MLPINGNLSYLSVSETNAVVTKDEQNGQLIIDWPNAKEKKATLTFKILQPGNYSLTAKTLRNQQVVHSAPLTVKASAGSASDTLFPNNQEAQVPKLESRSVPLAGDVVQPADFDNQNWLIKEVNRQLSPKTIGTDLTFTDLKKIQTINITDSYSKLTGTIPDGIKYLTNLTNLTLGNQRLSGTIPESIGELKNLQYLSLRTIGVSGNIPASIFNLPNIKNIAITGNYITGPIPSNVGNATTLEQLYLNQNKLTGPIPSSVGSLKNLDLLYLDHNQLTGHIPSSIPSIKGLMNLDLSFNQLTGPIPKSIVTLENLRVCKLSHNALIGPIDDFVNYFATQIKKYGDLGFSLSDNELSVINPKNLSVIKSDNPPDMQPLANNLFHIDYPNNPKMYELSLFRDYMTIASGYSTVPAQPGSKLYLFSLTEPQSLKIGEANQFGASTLIRQRLSKEHRYTIWDSDGKLIYDGLPDDNFSLTVPDHPAAYTVQIDNPNPPSKASINDPDILGYSIAGFRLDFQTLTSFKSANPENVDPKTETIKGEVGDTFTLEADIEGKGVPFYPGITAYNYPKFRDYFQVFYASFTLSPELKGKLAIDPKSFKLDDDDVSSLVTPIENGYRIHMPGNGSPALQGLNQPVKLSFNVSTIAPVSLEEGKNGIQTALTLSGGWEPEVFENKSSANVAVKRGLLQFHDVPATLEFDGGEVSSQPVSINRKDPNWQISVEDSRIKPNNWQVKAKLLAPFTNQKNQVLANSLIYKESGQPDKLISTTGDTVVFSGKGDGLNDYYSVSWAKNEGPFIQVPPGLARVGSPYVGQIQWTLSDAPA